MNQQYNPNDSNYYENQNNNEMNQQYQYNQQYYGNQPQYNQYQNQPPVNNMPAYGNGAIGIDNDDYILSQPAYDCSFGEAIRRFFVKYFDAKGRASRSEYWFVILFNFLIMGAIQIVNGILGISLSLSSSSTNLFNIIYGIYTLAILIPSVTLCIRRFHDIGRSGWWVLGFWLASFAGFIILIIGIVSIFGAVLSSSMSSNSVMLITIGGLLIGASSITSFIFTVMAPKTDGSNLKWDKYYQYYNM